MSKQTPLEEMGFVYRDGNWHSALGVVMRPGTFSVLNEAITEWYQQKQPKPVNAQRRELFESLCSILGHQNLRFTPGRDQKLKQRLKTFSRDEIILAAKAVADNEYMMGDNPSGKKYGTVDYLIRNDEKLDEWLDTARGGGQTIDLSKMEI